MGISESLTKFVRKTAGLTSPISPIVQHISFPIIKKCYRYRTWWICGRKYEAELDPFRLLWINPQRVERRARRIDPSPFMCNVWGGDWDHSTSPLIEYNLYVGLQRHFENGIPWKETEYYQRRARKIIDQGEWKECSTIGQLDNRCRKLDVLYEQLKRDGYRTQNELLRNNRGTLLKDDIEAIMPPELSEVAMHIGRDGEFIFHEGRHRLSIAKILGLDVMPIRVVLRHKQWQERRENIARGTGYIDENEVTHPDLEYLQPT